MIEIKISLKEDQAKMLLDILDEFIKINNFNQNPKCDCIEIGKIMVNIEKSLIINTIFKVSKLTDRELKSLISLISYDIENIFSVMQFRDVELQFGYQSDKYNELKDLLLDNLNREQKDRVLVLQFHEIKMITSIIDHELENYTSRKIYEQIIDLKKETNFLFWETESYYNLKEYYEFIQDLLSIAEKSGIIKILTIKELEYSNFHELLIKNDFLKYKT